MHIGKFAIATLLAAAVSVAAPKTASADWMFTPFIGAATGGNTADTATSFGGGLTWMGNGAIGFDVDFGYTPDYFADSADLVDNNLMTLMGNVIVGVPVGGQTGPGIRPYFVGGLGLMRTNFDDAEDVFDEFDKNGLGFNLGGGVTGFFTDNVGVRGDLRYFRSLDEDDREPGEFDLDLGTTNFWRATVGVTFRFGNE